MITKYRDQTQIVWHKATYVIAQTLSQKLPVTTHHNTTTEVDTQNIADNCLDTHNWSQDIESVNKIKNCKTIFVSPGCIYTHHPGDTAEIKRVFADVIMWSYVVIVEQNSCLRDQTEYTHFVHERLITKHSFCVQHTLRSDHMITPPHTSVISYSGDQSIVSRKSSAIFYVSTSVDTIVATHMLAWLCVIRFVSSGHGAL